MKKNELIIFLMSLFFSLILSIYLLLKSNNYSDSLLVLLPNIYLMGFVGIIKIYKYLKYPGLFILNVVSVIRYVILPIMIIHSNSYNLLDIHSIKGIYFMLFEAICLFGILFLITKFKYSLIPSDSNTSNSMIITNGKNLVLKFIVVISLIILVMKPSVLNQYQFVFSNPNNVTLIKQSELINGLSSIVFNLGKILLPIILSTPFIRKYKKTTHNINYIIVLLIFLLFNVLFFSGTSRNSVIMPAAGSLFFLMRVFPSQRKKTFLGGAIVIVIITIQLTIFKSSYVGRPLDLKLDEMIDYLNIYFVGPRNLGITIKSYERFGNNISYNTLINDIFGNFPGLSQFTNLENRTSTFFNLTFYNGSFQRDQIIPSIGQGLFYFGYVFSYLFQGIIVLGISYWDNKYINEKNIINIFLASTFAVRFGFTYISSLTSVLGYLYATIIPLTMIIFVNNKINNKFILKEED